MWPSAVGNSHGDLICCSAANRRNRREDANKRKKDQRLYEGSTEVPQKGQAATCLAGSDSAAQVQDSPQFQGGVYNLRSFTGLDLKLKLLSNLHLTVCPSQISRHRQ